MGVRWPSACPGGMAIVSDDLALLGPAERALLDGALATRPRLRRAASRAWPPFSRPARRRRRPPIPDATPQRRRPGHPLARRSRGTGAPTARLASSSARFAS